MINRKILIIYLTLLLIMILYIVNQVLFLNVLIKPAKSAYAWIDEEFNGFLLADNSKYIEAAKDVDKNTDTCTAFIDASTQKAVYTNECNLDGKTYISESQPYQDKSFIEYSSMYEYIYSIKMLMPIEGLSDIEFPRYNMIFTNSDTKDIRDMSKYLDGLNTKEQRKLYSIYSDDYKANVLEMQIIILKITSAIMLLLFIIGYVSLKRKEVYVFKILGLSSFKLVKKMFIDFFSMLSIAYIVAFAFFKIVTWSNGRLFYMSMYFEYMDIQASTVIYFVFLIAILIILSIYYVILRSKND